MKRVLVIGDACIDRFQYGTCDRLSPEAPVPVFTPTDIVRSYGMTRNVLQNLRMLGVSCDLITNDRSPIKTRYVDETSNQMLLRVDGNDRIDRIEHDVLYNINFELYDIVVISDYNKGFLITQDISYITSKHNLVFLDTKKKINKWAFGIEYIKINEKEYKENQEFLDLYYQGELIITLGKNGARHSNHTFPLETEHEVRDLSGAGDTFLAGLVADCLKNNDISKAIIFANKCASWAVSQRGVVAVNLKDIEND